ncbi:MAG: hypothetical protein J2P46_21775, partial [Zavarzinella sp.]|nr:hypothetical protein [Zavarzinella sp.]
TVGPAAGRAARVEELLARHGDAWRAESPAAPGVKWGDDLTRGFVHQAYLAASESFIPARDALFSVPLDDLAIDRVTTPGIRNWVTEPRLRRLRCLTLCGHFYDRGITALVSSPHVCNLETLYLGGDGRQTTDEGGQALLQSPFLAKLRRLYVAGCAFSGPLRAALRRRFPEAVV